MKKVLIFLALLLALYSLPLRNIPDPNICILCAIGSQNDVLPLASEIQRSKSTIQDHLSQLSGLIDTLTWRKEGASKVLDIGFSNPGDSMLVWLRPAAPCSLLAIRFRPVDFEGNMILDIWDASNYDPLIYSTDSTDENGFWGRYDPGACPSCWYPGDIVGHTPLGWREDDPDHHYWGPCPLTITSEHADSWIEIPADSGTQVIADLGSDPFFIGVAFYIRSGLGFYAQESYPGVRPFSFFKYYRPSDTSPGPEGGWFLRSYFPWFEAIVKYYEPTTSIQGNSDESICSSFQLFQNYPNPLTSIRYSLPEAANVNLQAYNTLGQVVAVLVDSWQEMGYHQVQWNATRMASGIYFFRLTAGSFTTTKRTVLMK